MFPMPERGRRVRLFAESDEHRRSMPSLRRRVSSRSTRTQRPSSRESYDFEQNREHAEFSEDDATLLWNQSFQRFLDLTTWHGVRDIFLSRTRFSCAFWTAVFISAIFLTIHSCWSLVHKYIHENVVISYYVQQVPEMRVPDVIVCPFNRFNGSQLAAWNVSFALGQYLELSYPNDAIFPFQVKLTEEIMNNATKYDNEMKELLSRLGNITYAEFINQATLGCHAFVHDEGNCENVTELLTSAGKCFRFPGRNQTDSGFGYGERLTIKLPESYYHPGANQYLNDGIIVKLAAPEKGIDNDLTFISVGVHALMPLVAVREEFLNDPPRYECDPDTDERYSRVYCYEKCLTEDAQLACGCAPSAAVDPVSKNICTAKQMYECFYAEIFERNETSLNDLRKGCLKQCKQPCTTWRYEKAVSFAFLSQKMASALGVDSVQRNEMKSTIVLDVYYTELEYTTIKHVLAMSFSSLLGQIGGQFSLYTGVSVISFLQAVYYMMEYYFYLMKKFRPIVVIPIFLQRIRARRGPRFRPTRTRNALTLPQQRSVPEPKSRTTTATSHLTESSHASTIKEQPIQPVMVSRVMMNDTPPQYTAYDEAAGPRMSISQPPVHRVSISQGYRPSVGGDSLLEKVFAAVELPPVGTTPRPLHDADYAIRHLDDVLAGEVGAIDLDLIAEEPSYRAPSSRVSQVTSQVTSNTSHMVPHVNGAQAYDHDEAYDKFEDNLPHPKIGQYRSRNNTIDSSASFAETRFGGFDVHDEHDNFTSNEINLRHNEVAYSRPEVPPSAPNSVASHSMTGSVHTGDTYKLRQLNREVEEARYRQLELTHKIEMEQSKVDRLRQQNIAKEAAMRVNQNHGAVGHGVVVSQGVTVSHGVGHAADVQHYRHSSVGSGSYPPANISSHSTKSVDSSIYDEEPVRTSPIAAKQKATGEVVGHEGKFELIVPQYQVVANFSRNSRINKVIVGGGDSCPADDDKTILLFGPVGSGKTAVINSCMNFLYDVKKENSFRFVLDTHVQPTTGLTAYVFHNTVLQYNVTIVDTPGVVDQKNNTAVSSLIKQWFEQELLLAGAFRLDAISIVLRHDENSLGWPFIYELAAVKKMFGDDLKTNVLPIITNAEVLPQPIAIKSLAQANISFLEYYKVNNLGFMPTARGISKLQHNLFFTHGTASLESLFQDLQELVHPLVAILRHSQGKKIDPAPIIHNATLY